MSLYCYRFVYTLNIVFTFSVEGYCEGIGSGPVAIGFNVRSFYHIGCDCYTAEYTATRIVVQEIRLTKGMIIYTIIYEKVFGFLG